MKHFFTLLIILAVHFAYAQAPQSIPYQAVVRNTDGTVMSNTALTMTFKIHDGSASGTVEYEESHTTSSNAQGLVALNVGGGAPITGAFNTINWGNGAKFLHVLMNAGNGVVDLGTQQMMSVPYALYSGSSNSSLNGIENFSVVGDTLFLNNGNYLVIPGLSFANAYNTNLANPRPLYYEGQGVTDIDGNFYPSIVINGQEWMQKNLRVTKYRNGVTIPTSISPYNTDASVAYEFSAENELLYGRLYNIQTVLSNQLCPTGWHVPSSTEWSTLINNLGGTSIAGRLLKSSSYWNLPNNASNLSNFSALPGGATSLYTYNTPNFTGVQSYGSWWSSSAYDNIGYYVNISLWNDSPQVNIGNIGGGMGLSIRCIKD